MAWFRRARLSKRVSKQSYVRTRHVFRAASILLLRSSSLQRRGGYLLS